ncbi:MAG: hypothetical protein L0Y72_27075 [Gemmataceae bacterium]|nr:hypothetical protein [Gemmataceae bacterium]MCI0742714.1 hypothetical protein [Gemmataceae bacterium]
MRVNCKHAVGAGLLCIIIVLLFRFALDHVDSVSRSPPRSFPTRIVDGRSEVFVKTQAAPEGVWLPIVPSTTSALVEFVPSTLSPGGLIVHVNADGTACLTDHVEASKRSQIERARRQATGSLP